jgi:nicotinamidase-related amidase
MAMVTALLVIDMQAEMAMRTARGQDRVNPQAEAHVASLLALFRARGLPVIHVHHSEPGMSIEAGDATAAVMPCALPLADETVLVKSASSAFTGTGLDALLRATGIDRIVLVGAVAGFCVTSTTRSASDLGYRVILPGDALIGFDVPRPDGSRIPAADVLDVTLTLLGLDFARVMPAAAVAAAL